MTPRRSFIRRRHLRRLAGGAAVHLAAAGRRAAAVDEAVAELQHDWEVIRYQTPPAEREKRFEALAAKAHKVSEANPGRSEPLIWEGIIVSSWPAKRAGSARWAWSSRPRRCTRRRSGSTARRSTARPTTAWAFSTTRCPAGRSASATRPRPRSCCRRRWRSIPRASIRTSSTASTWSRPSNPTRRALPRTRAAGARAAGPADRRRRAARGSARPAGEDQGRGSARASRSDCSTTAHAASPSSPAP